MGAVAASTYYAKKELAKIIVIGGEGDLVDNVNNDGNDETA